MRLVGIAQLLVGLAVVLAGDCGAQGSGSQTPTSPSQPIPTLPVPLPGAETSGRIGNLSTAADIITYNQSVNVGFSIPVEGRIERLQGIITRWELPIPVYVAPSITGTCVTEALSYWQSVTGLSFVLVAADAEPRITVRAAGADELKHLREDPDWSIAHIQNNQARLGVVRILTTSANCVAPSYLFRHELGHTIGIFGHIPGGGLMDASGGSITASQREIDLLTQLYRLPHGTRIEADGTWRVVQ